MDDKPHKPQFERPKQSSEEAIARAHEEQTHMTTTLTKMPSPSEMRAELEAMVLGDLLGPAEGESEELTERNVRDRYIVGVLAPSRAGALADAGVDEDDEETPLIPDELAEGGSDTADDGTTDQDVPVVSGHLPSSIGMTFCVDAAAKAIKVSACWGQYKREVREDRIDDRTGKPIRVWQRYTRGGVSEIPLNDGPLKATAPDAQFPDIYVQGQIRKRDAHWVVTLFLINAQESVRKNKDEVHVFHPVLTVEAVDGQPIFRKRMTVGSHHELEEHLMAMLYRPHVEFAVGHGVSVHTEVSEEASDRATLIRTEIVPRCEVPRTAQPNAADADGNPAFARLKGLVLDTKELAEADAATLTTMLGPLVTAYREWIDGEARKLGDPTEGLSQFGDAPRVAIDNCRHTLERIEAGLQLLQEDHQAFKAFQFMNRAMWLQRTHSIYAEAVRRGAQPDFDREIDLPQNRSWRPFQIAFILLNVPGVTKLDHPERGEGADALADLLFFPTGGGKTEA